MSKLCLIALVSAGWMLLPMAEEVQAQPDDGGPLIPRALMIKPVHTVVNEAFHRTDAITVKFREGLLVRLRDGSLTDLGTGALLGAEDVLAGVADGAWQRMHSVAEAKFDQWRQTAQTNLGRVVADLNLYFNLHLPPGGDAAATIDAFNSLEAVEIALPVPLPAPPPIPPDFEPLQGYLDPATDGVDAECLWLVPGGTGTGIKIVDIEYSFNPDHLDLSATLLGPAPSDWELYQSHGTRVLGEIDSLSNGWGTTGIAFDSTVYFVTHQPDQTDPHCLPPNNNDCS